MNYYQLKFNLEGTLVAKKSSSVEPFSDKLKVPNLQVLKLMQSLKSRDLVKETFNWQYYYYSLTDAGITFLRAQLGLPEDIVPATLQVIEGKTFVKPRPEREVRTNKGFNANRGERRERGERPERGERVYRKKEM